MYPTTLVEWAMALVFNCSRCPICRKFFRESRSIESTAWGPAGCAASVCLKCSEMRRHTLDARLQAEADRHAAWVEANKETR